MNPNGRTDIAANAGSPRSVHVTESSEDPLEKSLGSEHQPDIPTEALECEPEAQEMDQDVESIPSGSCPSVNDSEAIKDCDSQPTDVDGVQYTPPTFSVTPSLVHECHFKHFTKGVKWAKDGSNFAVVTDDNRIHVWKAVGNLTRYDVPEEVATEHVVTVREPQPINDFAWHPSHDLGSFVTTCNTQPLHMFEAATGKLLCSYVAKNHLDELVSAYSVQFSKCGAKICAGYKKFVRLFEVEYPGRSTEVSTWKQYQAGIVSAVDFGGENLLAVGTYCNSVALYDLRSREMTHNPVVGHSGGITQLRISFDGTLLYSGARKDNVIHCRDLRQFEEVLYEFPRVCATNQRMHFDLPYEEDFLATGNTDGSCYVWNLRDRQVYDENKCQPNLIFMPHTDLQKTKCSAANGISFHPWAPLLATSSGGRTTTVWDEETEQCVWKETPECAVKFWKFPA